MGWTSFQFKGNRAEFLEQEFNREPAWGTIIESAVVGSTIYAALKLGSKHQEREGKVTALIILTSIDKKQQYNFSYKDMQESVHPYQHECPRKILKLLSPVEDLFEEGSLSRQYATEWRQGCEDRLKAKAVPKVKITPGTIVKLAQPLNFAGGRSEDTFKNITGNLWQSVNLRFNTRFRIARYPFEVVPAEPQKQTA